LVYGVQNEKAQQIQLSDWKAAHATSGKDIVRQTELLCLIFFKITLVDFYRTN
jgi:hypothetical protein